MRIIVGGFLGLLPAGGVTWDYLQYVIGFAKLGHDVWYIEDTGLWPVFQGAAESAISSENNVAYLDAVMRDFGLSERWAYRDELTSQWFGLSEGRVKEVVRSADMVVNISCATVMREEYSSIPSRVLIDSDPMFTQIQGRDTIALTPGTPAMETSLASHTHHFSFGEKIGSEDCRVPECGVTWQPTRQPVCTWLWPELPLPQGRLRFTTVMNWTATRPFEFEGETWGQKDVEFARIIDLPSRLPSVTMEMAVTQSKSGDKAFPGQAVTAAGWSLRDPHEEASDWRKYQAYLQTSTGELSVAKEAYVKGRTGWFSCRSACYLASGRPVVTQETGWSELIPSGEGLFAFTDAESALEGLLAIVADPAAHSRAAREIAVEYFAAEKILTNLIDKAA